MGNPYSQAYIPHYFPTLYEYCRLLLSTISLYMYKIAKKLSKYSTVRTVVKVLYGPASGPRGLTFRYIWFHFRLNQSRQICRRIEQISKALKKQFFIEGPIHFSNLGQQ